VDHVRAADEVLEARGREEDVQVVEVVALVAEDRALREVALLELELGLGLRELELLETQLLAQEGELLARDRESLLDGGDLVAQAVEPLLDGRQPTVEVADLLVQRRLVLLGGLDPGARGPELLLQLGGRLRARARRDRPGERQGDGREDESGDE
jgi:hypothetical protein